MPVRKRELLISEYINQNTKVVELVFAECRWICKNNGIVVFSYISKIGIYTGACVHDKLREYYPNENANEIILTQNKDDFL